MEPGLIWILGGFLLLGAELLLPGIFLVWIGIAALGTGLLILAVAPGFGVVTVCFLLLLGAGIAAGVRLGRGKTKRGVGDAPNAHGAGLIGRVGTVLSAENTGLRVRLGDSDWAARLTAGDLMAAPTTGQAVRVEAVEGTILVVAVVH